MRTIAFATLFVFTFLYSQAAKRPLFNTAYTKPNALHVGFQYGITKYLGDASTGFSDEYFEYNWSLKLHYEPVHFLQYGLQYHRANFTGTRLQMEFRDEFSPYNRYLPQVNIQSEAHIFDFQAQVNLINYFWRKNAKFNYSAFDVFIGTGIEWGIFNAVQSTNYKLTEKELFRNPNIPQSSVRNKSIVGFQMNGGIYYTILQSVRITAGVKGTYWFSDYIDSYAYPGSGRDVTYIFNGGISLRMGRQISKHLKVKLFQK